LVRYGTISGAGKRLQPKRRLPLPRHLLGRRSDFSDCLGTGLSVFAVLGSLNGFEKWVRKLVKKISGFHASSISAPGQNAKNST